MAGDPIRVLVTAIGGFGHGEQILKALLQAPAERYTIYGADASARCPQFALVEAAYRLPLASAPDYLERLLDLCQSLRINALFHGCEPELRLFSEHREVLRSAGLFLPINPKPVIDLCMDKARTNAFLEAQGFSPPRTCLLMTQAEIDGVDIFPVVVKPSVGGGGSANCYIAQTRDELRAIYRLFDDAPGQTTLLAQEYVGTPDDEYTVGVLHDMDGQFINSIAVRRHLDSQLNLRMATANRTDRSDLGSRLVVSSGISHGEVGPFPAVTRACEEIASALGAAGPINIQCRLVDGKVKVFEVNPRFSGTTSLRAMMGYNEPDILVRRHLMGEEIEPRFDYRSGVVLRSLLETELTDAHSVQDIPPEDRPF